MATWKYISFSSGEISPALHSRVDLVKYLTGLRTCRNFMVMRHGGAANRPGTQFITEVKDSTKKVRLVPFVFNASQTYVLEFGDLYMRVIKDGELLGAPYELTTPYVEAHLPDIRFVQSADIITIVHPSYAPRELARTGDTAWTLTAITFGATIGIPTGLASNAPGTAQYYKVTAVDAESGEESLPSTGAGSTTQTSTLTWTAVSGAGYYNVYKLKNSQYSWIGIAGAVASPLFKDVTYTPDELDSPPVDRQPFTGTGNYPSTVTYYQQRLIFANTDNNPEGMWTSKSALRKNFMVSTPLQDDDAVTFSLVGRQVNEVNHLLETGKLIAFTASGEYAIEGGASGVLTPSDINPKQFTGNGSGFIAPLLVSGSAVYVQARGSVVRDLAYEFEANGYRGNELSIFNAHLVDNYAIMDWAYQQIPHSIIWITRDDGTLLGLTYIREHQVVGWHRHDTDGLFENVCVVPEGTEDALYVCVKRTINAVQKRYIERLYTRSINDIRDCVFVDSALSYDGRNTGATTMALSGGTNWTYDENLTLTASVSFFVSGDVGNEIWLYDLATGATVRCRIITYTSGTVVTVKPHKTVPVELRGVNTTDWSKAVDELGGLTHLEGKSVSIFADGFVYANPNNSAYEIATVTAGTVSLSDPHVVIHVGLPITADLVTLDIDTMQSMELAEKKKHVSGLTIHVEQSRGIWAGPDTDNLTELKIRNAEDYDEPVDLATGTVDINITGEWSDGGRVAIRQIDPIPLTVLSIMPNGFLGK